MSTCSAFVTPVAANVKELNPAELKKLMAARSGDFPPAERGEEESPQARPPPSKVVPFDDDSDDGEGIVLLADAEAEAEVRAVGARPARARARARGPPPAPSTT